ncbi:hypothetical protein Droror1_Dr00016331, partial [Drosera rotundifolia]
MGTAAKVVVEGEGEGWVRLGFPCGQRVAVAVVWAVERWRRRGREAAVWAAKKESVR